MAFKRAFLPIGMAGALIFAGPATTLAVGPVLDQQVTTNDNAHSVSSVIRPAQVFTAGITGNLTQIDVLVTTGPGPSKPSGDLTVEVWTVTGGAPDQAIDGASRTVLAADVPTGAGTWVSVPMKVHSVAGTQYAIVLSSPAPGGDCPETCWFWLADDNNPYAGGPSYYSLNGEGWVAQARDLDFKTYVLPLYTLQIYLSGVGEGANGTVTSGDLGIDCGATCLASYSEGRAITLTANPAVTATFGFWQGGPCDQSHNPVCSFSMPGQNVETGVTFYGIEATPPPGPTPTPSASHATPKPSAAASNGASPGASTDASEEPSGEPLESETASLEPGVTAAPSTAPIAIPGEPTSDDGGSVLPIVLGLILLIVLLGGAMYMSRRRPTAGLPPDAGTPPPPPEI